LDAWRKFAEFNFRELALRDPEQRGEGFLTISSAELADPTTNRYEMRSFGRPPRHGRLKSDSPFGIVYINYSILTSSGHDSDARRTTSRRFSLNLKQIEKARRSLPHAGTLEDREYLRSLYILFTFPRSAT